MPEETTNQTTSTFPTPTDYGTPNVVKSPSPTTNPADKADKFLNFTNARTYLTQLRDQWKTEVLATDGRRKTRDVELDTAALRKSGQLKEDETIIPVRTVDVNIKREQPAYINYLRNSRRIAIFTCLSQPGLDTQLLEQEYTKGMTYPEWETAYFKCIDGAQTHGWDSVEVVFDPSLPLHVGFEQIGHDKLYFSYDALHLQNCSRIMRAFDLTIQQLDKFVEAFGFSQEQVGILKSKKEEAGIKEETIFRVYKCFQKCSGFVYVSWCSLDDGSSDWLKAPSKLYLGRGEKVQVPQTVMQQVPGAMLPDGTMTMITKPMTQMVEQWQDIYETEYPIFVLPYQETEKQKITDHKGRVFLDGPKQEAQTAVLSGFVNGITRASAVYGSPTQDTADGGPVKVADVKLVNGAFLNKPVNFWHPDYPDPMVLRTLQYMDTSNAQEVGDVNFATLNRQDSRKTVGELNMSQQEAQKLDSVQLTLFSTFIRVKHGYAWRIVQSRALQGKLPYFLLKQNPQSGQYEQDLNAIAQVYDIRAAGDVDVIQKNESITKMMQDWPVISLTPLKDEFLKDIVKLKYPNDAERYIKILEQGDIKKQLIMQLGQALMTLVPKQTIANLPPEGQQQLAQLAQQTQQVLAQP